MDVPRGQTVLFPKVQTSALCFLMLDTIDPLDSWHTALATEVAYWSTQAVLPHTFTAKGLLKLKWLWVKNGHPFWNPSKWLAKD